MSCLISLLVIKMPSFRKKFSGFLLYIYLKTYVFWYQRLLIGNIFTVKGKQ